MAKWGEVLRLTRYQPDVGTPQGYFRFYVQDGGFQEVLAIGGKLYVDGFEVAIEGLTDPFQSTKKVEAVQYKSKLYIATGTKLVEYDGTIAKVVVPYTPDPQEALYIGLNGLADDPSNYIQDGTSAFLQVKALVPDKRYGVVNEPTEFTAYTTYPNGSTIEFRFDYRLRSDDGTGEWTEIKTWSTTKTATFTPRQVADYELRVQGRIQGQTEIEEYYLPRYVVKISDDIEELPYSGVHTCNRIILHWSRIILYGSDTDKDMIYISDLDRMDYIPVSNTLRFENEQQEGLTTLVRYRDMIVAFTPNTIQALFGKSPLDFSRITLHSSLGCIAADSAKVMGNYVTFLSSEGIHILRSVGYVDSKMNVEKIDSRVSRYVYLDDDAYAEVHDSQYHLVYPSRGVRLRFYYDQKIWTKDLSSKFENFAGLYVYDGELFGMGQKGVVYRFDPNTYSDDGEIFDCVIETKHFDFGEPYNPKKLKEIQLLLGHPSDSFAYVYVDGTAAIQPSEGYASVGEDGVVKWNTTFTPNIDLSPGTKLGNWEMGHSAFGDNPVRLKKLKVSGKCLRTKLKIVHDKNEAHSVVGIGFIFKTKKP